MTDPHFVTLKARLNDLDAEVERARNATWALPAPLFRALSAVALIGTAALGLTATLL